MENKEITSDLKEKITGERKEISNAKKGKKSFIIRTINNRKYAFVSSIVSLENKDFKLIISKDIEFIHKISDNVIILKDSIINQGNKYDIFTNENYNQFKIPKTIEFSKRVYELRNIKIGYRDDIKDLMKDIYRYVKWGIIWDI